MSRFSSILLLSLVLSQASFAEIKKSSDDDALSMVNQKLTQIDKHLRDQKIHISSATMEWSQLDSFKSDLMFVAAHDPNGPVPKDTPAEMMPSFLTQKLKQKWTELEVSVLSTGEMASDPEWIAFKDQVEQYIKLREEFLYQPARNILRSGSMWGMFQKVKESYAKEMKEVSGAKNLTVRVVDPYIEKMATEISELHKSVRQLKEFRTPPKKENPSIFQPKHQVELAILGGGVFFASVLLTFSFLWLKKKLAKKPVEEKPAVNPNAFNYYEWLKRLEASLQTIKNNEENTSEEYIHLKEFTAGLRAARKGLNEADTQQEYYVSLEQLNAAAPKIEEYFEKVNLKKNGEASRRLISHIVQLCEAIEAKKEMSFEDEKPKLRLIKQEKINGSKAA